MIFVLISIITINDRTNTKTSIKVEFKLRFFGSEFAIFQAPIYELIG
jgi:hypothetical protein